NRPAMVSVWMPEGSVLKYMAENSPVSGYAISLASDLPRRVIELTGCTAYKHCGRPGISAFIQCHPRRSLRCKPATKTARTPQTELHRSGTCSSTKGGRW
ncbi:unnamed protein product, partial [Mycena citricolor]